MVHADLEIEHDEDRRLQPVGKTKAWAPNSKDFGRVLREQQHVLGVAVRRVGARERTSHCWVRVGMPVEGPARWTSKMTAGISAK